MLEVALYSPRQHQQFQHTAGSIVLARADEPEPLWSTIDRECATAAGTKVEIVADADGIRLQTSGCEKEESCVPRSDPLDNGRLPLPVQFSIGDTRFEVTRGTAHQASSLRPLETLLEDRRTRAAPASNTSNGPSPTTLSRWFHALGTLHRWSSSSQGFFVQAAQCAVDAIGLDGAMVLRRRDEAWEIAASYLPHPELGIHYDVTALNELARMPQTLFHGSDQSEPDEDNESGERSAQGEAAVVVSPFFSAAGELAGAVYGFRSVRADNSRRGIRYLEAHLIELLAHSISEFIVRLEREGEVGRRRALWEQTLAAAAVEQTASIVNERREVTLLFADLRGFSPLAHSLGTQQTYDLLGDVMEALTAAVLDHDGVIVDYFGDGLAAMWNAPASQPEHPELACRAALQMHKTLPAVQSRWSESLVDDLRLGIGVHTGVAQVGNAGSKRRIKYGPRGASVHLASRVEAATKLLGVPLVVTGATAARLSSRLRVCRLCRARLPGISDAIELFGVHPSSVEPRVLAEFRDYQRALELFEHGDLDSAADWLAKLGTLTGSMPTAFLADQIDELRCHQQGRRSTDPTTAAGPVITLNVK
jgi:adenylate cyclase